MNPSASSSSSWSLAGKQPRHTAPLSFLPLRAYTRANLRSASASSSLVAVALLAALLACCSTSASSAAMVRGPTCDTPLFPYRTIPQPVDHFDSQNAATFPQRYWNQSSWWGSKPQQERQFVFLRINSFSMPHIDMENSTLALWAKELGALYFQIEPRYSPCSSPVANFSTADLRYCSVEQILADFVNFIGYQTRLLNLTTTTRWVVVGELFDGAYATWLRSKPHLTFGSISISPHLNGILEYKGYDEAYQQFLGSTCAHGIHTVMSDLSTFFNDTNSDTNTYQAVAGCSFPLPNSEFLYVASTILLGSLGEICANITKANSGTSQERLTNLASLLKAINTIPCEDWDFAQDNSTVIGDMASDFRPIYYLKCTQFGQFETPSDPATTVLPLQRNLEWYLQVCQDLFDDIPATPAVDTLNQNYGGRDPAGCNMLFVVSPNDPYVALGPDTRVIEAKQLQTANRVLNLACSTPLSGLSVLGEPSSADPTCLKGTRQQIIATLRSWQQQAITCAGQGGGGGDGDDSGKLALVGTLAGFFGVGLGIIIGLVAFYYVSRFAYRKYLTAGWSKIN